jgi:hypothetical protein
MLNKMVTEIESKIGDLPIKTFTSQNQDHCEELMEDRLKLRIPIGSFRTHPYEEIDSDLSKVNPGDPKIKDILLKLREEPTPMSEIINTAWIGRKEMVLKSFGNVFLM